MASPAKALTEEQRQQIIATLLAERRSRSAGQTHTVQETEQRTIRLQHLLAERAATRQHAHGETPCTAIAVLQCSLSTCLGVSAGVQQRGVQLHTNGLSQDHASVKQEQSLDALLSPGSTCSLNSNLVASDCAWHKMRFAQQAASRITGSAPHQQTYIAQQQSTVLQQLHEVADGPVDVSNLWEASGWPSEQLSSLPVEDEYEASYASPSEHSSGGCMHQLTTDWDFLPLSPEHTSCDNLPRDSCDNRCDALLCTWGQGIARILLWVLLHAHLPS